MTELIRVPQVEQWGRLKALVLDSVSSPITRRVYNLGLDEFFTWYGQEARAGFTKATVAAWRVALEGRAWRPDHRCPQVGGGSRRQRPASAGTGQRDHAGEGCPVKGSPLGKLLSDRQAQTLLNAPDATTSKGLRDRAILAVLLGCGLRRSEVAALTIAHIQQRDGCWCIVDLVGKHGRIRTIPMPTWVKVAIDSWTTVASVVDGHVFRVVNRAGERYGQGILSRRWFSDIPAFDTHSCDTLSKCVSEQYCFFCLAVARPLVHSRSRIP